jgi:hypothetical protein
MNHPIRSRADLVTWIESCVLGDLRTLLVGVDAYYASPTHVGQDGRPLGAANFLLWPDAAQPSTTLASS